MKTVTIQVTVSPEDADAMFEALNSDDGLRNRVADWLLTSAGQQQVLNRLAIVRFLGALSAGLKAGLQSSGRWYDATRLREWLAKLGDDAKTVGRVVGLAAVLLTLAVSPVVAQVVPAAALGWTSCDSTTGQPVTGYAANFDAFTIEQLEAHEAVHRQQYAPDSSGTCVEKMARSNRSPVEALRWEVPAYCAQARWGDERGIDVTGFVEATMAVLSWFYNLPYSTIRAHFMAAGGCWSGESYVPNIGGE